MNNKLKRAAIRSSNPNLFLPPFYLQKKKGVRKSIKSKPAIKGQMIVRIEEGMKKSYLNREKDYEKKLRHILNKNINKDTAPAQDNFYSMIISNIISYKSHRIRTKYSERFLEINPYDMFHKYYKRNDAYDILKYLTKSYKNNNIIFFPNYFPNESVYYIMGKYLEEKEKLFIKSEEDNQILMEYQLLKTKNRNKFQDYSNKILETFSKDNLIDVENNLKNLNNESLDYSHANISNSSYKVKNLIYELNNNLKRKKENKKIFFPKNFAKLKTKTYDENKTNEIKNKLRIKRLATSKLITVDKNIIIQKLYLDDFLAKRFDYFKRKGTFHKNNDNDINMEKISNLNEKYNKYFSRNSININNYNYKTLNQPTNYFFKPTDLFIYDFFKEQHLNRKKKIKKTIINSIKEYETLKTEKIVAFLKAKEKSMIKGFTFSSSRKKLKLKNFVQKDGFSTEITQVKDLLKQQKLKAGKSLHLKGNNIFNDNKEIKNNIKYIPSEKLFYRNCDRYINSESLTERIKLNIKKLLKKKKFSNTISVLFKKSK